jgi:hypothetical protein
MRKRAQQLVFAAPEIVTLIAQYLSPRDISQWMMTCKAFSHRLEHSFWSHPVMTKALDTPKSLSRYVHHFQTWKVRLDKWFETTMADLPTPTLRTSSFMPAAPVSSIVFPCLKKLSIYSDVLGNPLTATPLLVLHHSPNLTELDIRYPFKLDPSLTHLLLIVLSSKLPCLQRLAVKLSKFNQVPGFRLLEVCFNHPQLIDLRCNFYIDVDSYSSEDNEYYGYTPKLDALLKSLQGADKAKADAGLPTGLLLKSLVLPEIGDGYPMDFLIQLFRSHVPHLERFRMPTVHGQICKFDLQILEESMTAGCPKLQHLSSSPWLLSDHSDAFIAAIYSCARTRGLKSYIGYRYDEGYPETSPVLMNLMAYHAETLEEIEFQECMHVNSPSILSIVTTCRNLRTLRVCPEYKWMASLRYQDVYLEWVCRDLTVLDLLVDRNVIAPEGEIEIEVMIQSAQRFFAQVGRLTKLEELSLGGKWVLGFEMEQQVSYDLTLQGGWLGELAGLKQLKHLWMYTDYWSFMNERDVEFMDTKWPKLEKISFGCGDGYDRNVLQKDLWEGLKEMRPFIVYA